MENGFYRLGVAIGKVPVAFIVGVFVLVLIMLPGIFVKFEEETDPLNLWTPYDILARDHKKWVDKKYPTSVRFQSFLIEADDVLTPEVIQAMYDLDVEVKAISGNRYSWERLCARIGPTCWTNSLLELWSFDESTINSLTKEDIVDTINNATVSPVYQSEYDAEAILGEIRYEGGRIYKAKATTMTYFLNVSDTTDLPESDPIWDWELDFLEIGEDGHRDVEVYYFSGRSFSDEGGGAILGDISLLSTGYIILVVFVFLVIGKFNCVQQRVYVTLGGVLCIGLAIAFAIGFCSYIGVLWGPLHNVLPFLLLGIGVDDMFVIVQCYDQLGPETKGHPVHEKIGLALKHAGMSILVTSITDICAFAVGATTILPALRSFCIYSAVGILANFLFQCTLFVACVALDQRRVEADRNACFCCYSHRDYTPNRCSQRSFADSFFLNVYAPFIVKLPVKILVFVVALGMFGLNLYGVAQLEQDFDYRWFIPSDSYASEYFDKSDKYFPDDGDSVNVYLGRVNYFSKHSQLLELKENALSNRYTQSSSLDVWYDQFILWVDANHADGNVSGLIDADRYPSSEENYATLLDLYLEGAGVRFTQDLVFDSRGIEASRFSLMLKEQDNSAQEIKAMDSIREICDSPELGGATCFVYSDEFLDYEGNRVIQEELYRNLGLAFMCVFIMTLILLANVWSCFLVCLCVIMSLIDVGGFMYFWGLTIDTVTTINLLIAIGLTVDYSAHVAHTFMTMVGTRDQRVRKTLGYIGAAVFYGGFSTFLAFVLLSMSNSYVFKTFFKVFFLVVLVGLFHGLLVLPVILSWVGPPAYQSAKAAFGDKSSPRVENKSAGHAYSAENGDVGKEKVENGDIGKEKAENALDNPGYRNGDQTENDQS